jgi:uncharacterized oligopeptide transporter (OPT) family protein
MGKITQLMYGVVAPSNITTNLMTASITSGAASHAADLLTDLKSGYLLGGNPRKQTISQLFGVIAGTIVSVPAYLFVVQRDPTRLGSEALPAPSAKVWAGVAELLANGIQALPAGALQAIAVGAGLGIALTLLEEFGPKAWRPWLPSTTGLGIAGGAESRPGRRKARDCASVKTGLMHLRSRDCQQAREGLRGRPRV